MNLLKTRTELSAKSCCSKKILLHRYSLVIQKVFSIIAIFKKIFWVSFSRFLFVENGKYHVSSILGRSETA